MRSKNDIGHLIAAMTGGNQKWKGAIPSLMIRPVKINKGRLNDLAPNRRRAEPRA